MEIFGELNEHKEMKVNIKNLAYNILMYTCKNNTL